MALFLIEIPHAGDVIECNRVIRLFVTSGSHLLSNAHWGCKDGIHKAWFISEFESKEEALRTIPAYFKRNATVVELVKFDKTDIANFAESAEPKEE